MGGQRGRNVARRCREQVVGVSSSERGERGTSAVSQRKNGGLPCTLTKIEKLNHGDGG
jgi:hypothetical protein